MSRFWTEARSQSEDMASPSWRREQALVTYRRRMAASLVMNQAITLTVPHLPGEGENNPSHARQDKWQISYHLAIKLTLIPQPIVTARHQTHDFCLLFNLAAHQWLSTFRHMSTASATILVLYLTANHGARLSNIVASLSWGCSLKKELHAIELLTLCSVSVTVRWHTGN